MKYLVKIGYIGKYFYGSQIQPDVPTVEGELKKVLKELGYKTKTEFSSRTDKGVSAIGNVVALYEKPDLKAITYNLENIYLWAITKVPDYFYPRWASMRHYRYLLFGNYNLKTLREHAKLFEGYHNFSNFCKGIPKNPFRKIYKISIKKQGNLIIFDIYGRNFLRQMIRKMISYFIKVCEENISLEYTKQIVDCEVKEWIPPAPAENLILVDVKYKKLRFRKDIEVLKKMVEDFNSKLFELNKEFVLYQNIKEILEKRIS
jgi:tRNA pseudouridine38-40 synthase